MSRDHCQDWKTWINDLPYCSYHRNILCEDVEECPAHYDDEEDDIGEPYEAQEDDGDGGDEIVLRVKYKGIIVDLKDAIEITDDGETRKVIFLTLDNGISLKSDYYLGFYKKLQEVQQAKRVVKFVVDAYTNMIEFISYKVDELGGATKTYQA